MYRIVSLFVLVAVCLAATPSIAEDIKVLFVGKQPDHPYGTHMYLHTCGVLAKCIKRVGNVETVISDGWPKDSETLEGVDVIVVYSTPAAEFLLDGPHRNKVIQMMDDGVGLVTIHWASSIFQQNLKRLGPVWMRCMGATWVSNVGLHTGKSTLKQLQPEHPICRGWKPYELHDEYYLNPTIDKATPLLQVMVKEKPVVVGWAYERPDGGRSYGTTLGHFYRNFQQEAFRRTIVNAILWSAGRTVPEGGADVALSEAELALPKMP